MSVADQPEPTAIEGVQVIPLGRIPDERGTIFHMLRADDPHFIAVRRDLLLDRSTTASSRAGTGTAR